MGIILLTELGAAPWQQRFSVSWPLLVVWQLMLASTDMDLALPSMAMELPAMKPEAPRDLEDTMATMESARGLLMPLTTMEEPLLLSMSTVLSMPMDMESTMLER